MASSAKSSSETRLLTIAVATVKGIAELRGARSRWNRLGRVRSHRIRTAWRPSPRVATVTRLDLFGFEVVLLDQLQRGGRSHDACTWKSG